MKLKLIIKKDHLRMLKEEVKRAYPVEACALLFGCTKDDEIVVEEVMIMSNENGSNISFMIDPELFYVVYKRMEEEGREYVGVFHSHPARSSPSTADERAMRLWPNVVWLIYSTLDGSFSAYVFEGGKLNEVDVKVV